MAWSGRTGAAGVAAPAATEAGAAGAAPAMGAAPLIGAAGAAGAAPRALPAAHIPSLDGLRAFSIAVVFLSHAGVSELIPGGFGVTVFFFLSGFLITTLLTREQGRHGSVSLRAFYLRRALRLAPPILVTIAAATLLALAGLVGGDLAPGAYLSQIFFYSNYYGLQDARSSVEGLEILWSLSVEEHFYFLWPLLFIAIARGMIGLRGVGLLLALILAWRAWRVLVLGADEWVTYVSTDTRLDSLLYGCLLALLMWRGQASRLFPDAAWPRFLWLGAAAVVLVATFVIRDPDFRAVLRYSLQGLALTPVFYYAVVRPDIALFRPLNWPLVRRIGVWSFTIYLCHFVILNLLTRNGVGEIGDPLVVLLAAVLSCGFAALVARYAERPLQPLRARLTGH